MTDSRGNGVDRPLHVALVYWDPFSPGGVQSQIAGRIEALGRPGGPVRYTVFSARAPKHDQSPHVRLVMFSGWPHLSIAVWELTASFSLSRALARVHAEDPFDLVDLHAIGTSPFVMPWARRAGVPVVATCHSLRFFSIPDHGHRWETALYYRWSNRRAFRGADCVIAVSESVKRELISFGVASSRIVVSHPAALPSVAKVDQRRSRPAGDPFELVFVGRTSREKGLEVLLEALRMMKSPDRTQEVRLSVVGSVAGESRLRSFSQEENLPVAFLGPLENREARSAMARADLVVVPSIYEPFGIVCIEAMLEGTLLVGSRVGGIPEIIDDGKTGLLVSPGDAEALARAIERIVRNPQAFPEIRQRAKEAALNHTWDARGPELLALYRELMPSVGVAG